uniref:Ferrienterobactin receptor n=1 Tax=Talaromyces marneffei PM1 TaxID=1077442 RepID=A0A093VFV4_TALMA
MSFHQDEFQDLEDLIFGLGQSLDGSNEESSWGRSDMSFFDEFLQENDDPRLQPILDEAQESEGILAEAVRALINYTHPDDLSSTAINMNTNNGLGLDRPLDVLRPLLNENPYRTGYQNVNLQPQSDENPYRTEYQTTNPRPRPEPILGRQNVNPQPASEQIIHSMAGQNPEMVTSYGNANMHGMHDSYFSPPVHNDPRPTTASTYANTSETAGSPVSFDMIGNLIPKREASAVSRRLSDISAEGDQTLGSAAAKRMHSSEVEGTNDDLTQDDSRRKRRRVITPDHNHKIEWDDSTRPKYTRKIVNENARYRHALKLRRAKSSCPEGVKSLYQHLKSEIIPKKSYYRKKGTEATVSATAPGAAASHQFVPPAAGTVLSGGGGATSSSTSNRRARQANPRTHIPVETVRQAAPEGWDPYDNGYYSGDDNVSDAGKEIRAKAAM